MRSQLDSFFFPSSFVRHSEDPAAPDLTLLLAEGNRWGVVITRFFFFPSNKRESAAALLSYPGASACRWALRVPFSLRREAQGDYSTLPRSGIDRNGVYAPSFPIIYSPAHARKHHFLPPFLDETSVPALGRFSLSFYLTHQASSRMEIAPPLRERKKPPPFSPL